MISRTRK